MTAPFYSGHGGRPGAPQRPPAQRCCRCGALACYGIGPAGWPLAPPTAWYCAAHVPPPGLDRPPAGTGPAAPTGGLEAGAGAGRKAPAPRQGGDRVRDRVRDQGRLL